MTAGPGIEPGTHWQKVSALTTAPTLLPEIGLKVTVQVEFEQKTLFLFM